MSEVTAYSCPNCKATLKLDPQSGKLTCEFCDSSFDVDEIEKRVNETSAARAQAEEKEAKHARRRKKEEGESSVLDKVDETRHTIDEWDELLAQGQVEQFDEVVSYVCVNCGAQVVTDKLTVATNCQYCGSSVVVDERLTGGLKPSFVLPFKVKAKDLPDRLTKFYSERPLLPDNFFYENQVGEVQGLYVPFWLYDGTFDGAASYTSEKILSWTEGSYDVTEVTTYRSERVGHVTFSHVPVDASKRIDDDLMDSIEPFNYNDMVPFKAGYLTGFLAERFDRSPRDEFSRSSSRMQASAQDVFRDSTPTGSKTVESSFQMRAAAASYVFLPVYLFNCKYNGKMYRYAVNGQTGKIVGEVPSCGKKARMAFLKAFAKWTPISFAIMAVLVFVATVL